MPPEAAASSRSEGAARTPFHAPAELARLLEGYLAQHPNGVVLEDGKPLFDLVSTQHTVSAEHDRCTLQLWNEQRNLVRTVASATARGDTLRLQTQRFGNSALKTLVLAPGLERREPRQREAVRQSYTRILQRVLAREFPDWQVEAFRAAMDLERSFGPAYARGTLLRGKEAWAVIGVGAAEAPSVVDGILTLGILWLHHCRERSDGKRLYKGLRIIMPKGMSTLTSARLAWLNPNLAHWQLFQLDEQSEQLAECDPADQGNLRNRILHLPDSQAALERFSIAIAEVQALVPAGEGHRVEQRLRSSTELAFLLHGLEFARAKLAPAAHRFAHEVEITVGVASAETPLSASTFAGLQQHVAELFARRNPAVMSLARQLRPHAPGRGIGAFTGRPAHARLAHSVMTQEADQGAPATDRLAMRERRLAAQQDPLFRALPERWLESVLRENLAPLTRSLAPTPASQARTLEDFANDADPDTRGNRVDPSGWTLSLHPLGNPRDRLIPRFDPRFAYTQVPAIAGAGDRGMLDLLGLTEDGRLAVIEVKASDDLQLALQGLDYWIRVRHHHTTATDSQGSGTGLNDLQQHGYFRGVALSPLPPRLYLVAPALQVHPATETILRYFSPRVEWSLLALDERWRQQVRVVWRKSGGQTKGARLTSGLQDADDLGSCPAA